MKKLFLALIFTILLLSCVYAENESVEINGVEFEIPTQYQGGEIKKDIYRLDNVFSISCVDDDISNAIGLWAEEQESSEDLNIAGHPVRHFCQYNKYVSGNHSHAYFASGESVYEISWVGNEIDDTIKKLIKNTPPSKISDEDFENILDISYKIYKEDKIDKLNSDAEYNYLESKYNSKLNEKNTHDDTQFKRILYTYYLNK